MFGGCVLACQVSKVRVQAVQEDWELAKEIRDGGGKDWSDLLGRKMQVLPPVQEEWSHLKGSEHGEIREAADPEREQYAQKLREQIPFPACSWNSFCPHQKFS